MVITSITQAIVATNRARDWQTQCDHLEDNPRLAAMKQAASRLMTSGLPTKRRMSRPESLFIKQERMTTGAIRSCFDFEANLTSDDGYRRSINCRGVGLRGCRTTSSSPEHRANIAHRMLCIRISLYHL